MRLLQVIRRIQVLPKKTSTTIFRFDLMRFDLKRPCKNCPFANTPDRITFACRDRAQEIETLAYRKGFVCHEHSEHVDDTEYEAGGFVFRNDGSSQHCWGVIAMYLKDGGSSVPWERAKEDDPDLEERWWDRADKDALKTVFENEEDFLEANNG